MHLEDKIKEEIYKIIKTHYKEDLTEINFEKPADILNGNLSTNIALKNARLLKEPPLNIAQTISDNFPELVEIKKIEAVKPGFLNFYYSNEYFKNIVEYRLTENFFEFQKKNENINVEFVSANPTGELHLGHARNAAYGDSIANLYARCGYEVTKEYYINDAGVQMRALGESVKYFYFKLCGKSYEFPETGYKGPEIEQIAQKLFTEIGTTWIEKKIEEFIDYAYTFNLQEIKAVLKQLNIKFDVYTSERMFHEKGLVSNIVDQLKQTNDVYEKDSALWLKTTNYDDDKDRVLIKKDQTYTYLTPDIAYHYDKFRRTEGKLINIWGADHHGYVKRIKAAMQILGQKPEDLNVLFIQMVSVVEAGEKIKMSKRAGTSVTIKDLLKIIDSETLRYFFIMRNPDTQLEFDIALAQKENSENPIFYIQYAHARIESILNKVKEQNFEKNAIIYSDNLTQIDLNLIDVIEQYEIILEESMQSHKPHILSNYLYELATEYHRYYNQEKIINEKKNIQNNKILISSLVQKIIADGLNILGIKAKNKM